ncbi:MAG: beta-lactamase family protein, partial [Bdellovibrionales bacterium]|nr:beta-lactamase family protein [Bdellovibrionales bacterium]
MISGFLGALIISAQVVGAQASGHLRQLEAFNRGGGGAASVLVLRKDKVLLERQYGFHDLKKQKKTSVNALFNLASVSKQMTAMSILLLEQKGLLNASSSIRDFLTGLPQIYQQVKVRDLIYHVSGLPDYGDVICKGPKRKTNADVIQFLKSARRLEFAPGTRFEYSNTGYSLLSSIVEVVTGETLNSFLQQEFFDPLGIRGAAILNAQNALDPLL